MKNLIVILKSIIKNYFSVAIITSFLVSQPSFNFEIIPIPNMETPLRMNSSGTTLVGTNFGGQAVYWSDSTGTIALGMGELWGISNNGRIFSTLKNSNNNWEAALTEDGESNFLGNVDGGNTCDAFYSNGLGMSSDGSIGVGMGWIDCTTSAFYWTDSSGMVELGQYDGQSTKAQAVAGDGSLIGGWAQTDNRSSCVWDRQGNISFLGSLQQNNDYGEVQFINNNGSIIAGYCAGSTGNNVEGYIWSEESGMFGLGVPENEASTNVSRVFDMSENMVAVGEYLYESPIFYKACIYNNETEHFVNLKSYLLDKGMSDIENWDLVKALCISDDGNAIAGYGKDPSGNWTGWLLNIIVDDNVGDINEDGLVDIADVLILISYLLGDELTDSELIAADIDYNIVIDIYDLIALIDTII